jgi:hypothetical protein
MRMSDGCRMLMSIVRRWGSGSFSFYAVFTLTMQETNGGGKKIFYLATSFIKGIKDFSFDRDRSQLFKRFSGPNLSANFCPSSPRVLKPSNAQPS